VLPLKARIRALLTGVETDFGSHMAEGIGANFGGASISTRLADRR